MLNATAALSSGDLTITDTSGVANTFIVKSSSGNLIVSEANGNGFSSVPPEASLSADGRTMTIPQTAVTGTLTINASGGNDSFVFQGVTGSMNIVVDGGIGTDVVNVGAGGVSLTAGNIAATAETINVGDAVGTSSGTINLAGNAISILAAVNAGSNSVTLRTNSSSAINLGAADSAGTLGLTDAELDFVIAGSIVIGDSNTTSVTISADITRASSIPMSITSTGAISFTTGLINTAGGNLTLSPGTAGVSVTKTGVDINVGTGIVSFANNSNLNFQITGTTVDTQYHQLNVVGQVNLTGVNLVRTGSYAPNVTNSFILVNNDGVDPIVGTFNGLVEGATVTVNGVNMTITYVGGDGNDVVLLPPPSTTATLSSGVLTIADTSLSGIANNYTATVVGPNLVITDTSGAIFGAPPAGGVLSNNNQTLTIPLSSVSSLVVNGGLLNDTINIQGLSGTLNLSVDGGAGTDNANFQTTASSIIGSLTVTSESVNVNAALSSNNNDITINATTLLSPSTINAGTGKALLAGPTAGTPIVLQDNSFAATGGGANADTVFATATDADGNIYVAGVTNTAIKDFNGTSVTGFGSDDIYVAKFNKAGVQQWFKLAGSVFQDSVSAMTVDLAGNVYVAGTVPTTTTDFAGNTLTAYGQQDVYVAKLNTNGVQQWFKLSGSTNTDSVTAISVDSSGNLIVAGAITGTAGNTPKDFNGTTVSGYQFSDVFVAKLNASGVQQWYKIAGSTSFDSVSVVTTDTTGNVYLAGVVVGGSTPKDFNGVNTASYGSNEIFIAKLDSLGAQQWFNVAGSTGADSIAALTVDASGNVYAGGLITGTAANAPKDFAGATVTGVGGADTWLAKLNGSGVQQWFKLSGSTQGSDTLTAITIDGSGNIYATGTIDTTVSSTPKDFNLTTVTGYLNSDVYVAKLDSNGVQQWFKLTGSSNADSVVSLLLDSSNNVYVAGHIGGSNSPRDFNGTAVTGIGNFDVFVSKLSTSGVQQWFRLGGFNAVDNVAAMQLDALGNVYMTGIFGSQLTAGRDFAGNAIASPTTAASSDIYVARISTTGIQQQFDLIGSTSVDTVRNLRVDASGNAFVTGQFFGTIDFDAGPGVVSRVSNGGLDAFVWRLQNLSNTTISDAALDQITAATVQIGNATAGPITVASDQTRPTATNVEFVSGSSISFTSGSFDTAGGNLKLTPGTGSNATAPKAGVDVNLGSTGTLSFGSSSNLAFDIRGTAVDTQFDQLNVVGKVDLSGSNLVLTGAFVPSSGDSFKIIDNDGTSDPIVGTFAGLLQGATVTFNGIPLTISYTGGDGNDVVLTYSVSNTPPTAVVLTLSLASLAENASTVSAIVLSTILITDDGQGSNTTNLTGADASFFEIVGNQLRLKAGTALDYEAKTNYSVTVEVDDTAVGTTPDVTATFALNITDVSDAPSLVSVVVNGGDTFLNAAQRSQVTSLVVTFSAPVVLAANPFAIVDNGLTSLLGSPVSINPTQILITGSGTTYTLRFGAGPGVITRDTSTGLGRGNSLADGNFLLTIDPSKVKDLANVQTLTPTNSFGDGDNEFGDRAVDNFFRLFGDSDGNGWVNSLDTGAFSRATLVYNAAVDFNGDGLVQNSGVDRSNFLGNYNKRRRSF